MIVQDLFKIKKSEHAQWFSSLKPISSNRIIIEVERWVDGEGILCLEVYDKEKIRQWALEGCYPNNKPAEELWEMDSPSEFAAYEVFGLSPSMHDKLVDKVYFMFLRHLKFEQEFQVRRGEVLSFRDDIAMDGELESEIPKQRVTSKREYPIEDDELKMIIRDIHCTEVNICYQLLRYVNSTGIR